MAVTVSPPPPKTDRKFDDWMHLFWKRVTFALTPSRGSVVQTTSKSTSVTLDAKCGTIDMDGAALNASTSVSFTMYNSDIEVMDVVALTIRGNASLGSYLTQVEYTGSGECSIALRNISGGTLSESVQLNFAIIKAYN